MTRVKRLPLTAAIVAIAAALACAIGAGQASAVASPSRAGSPAGDAGGAESLAGDDHPFVPGELLVRFRGRPPQREYQLPAGIGVRAAARALEQNPRVRWAVPNYVARAASPGWIPNDRGRKGAAPGAWQELQWNFLPCGSACGEDPGSALESIGGIDAPGAWENLIEVGHPGGRGVKIAIVDTGVAHRNRGRRFRRSPDLKGGQFEHGRDYVDDDHAALDENGHGTHVASTIGERTNNKKFVTGLAYGAKLIPIRVLNEEGKGGSADVARGIRWAFKHGADVINLSLEFSRKVDGCDDVPGVCDAIDKAHAKGAVVVSVAGNGSLFGSPRIAYPGRAPHVIATGATTLGSCLADYSNFGDGLDISAPGGGFDAPDAGSQCQPSAGSRGIVQLTLTKTGSDKFRSFGYGHEEGTSMASAHVAGTAALVWASLRAGLGRPPTPDEVEARLKSTARTDGDLGDPNLYGSGLLDAAAATEPLP
jgi:serine protease